MSIRLRAQQNGATSRIRTGTVASHYILSVARIPISPLSHKKWSGRRDSNPQHQPWQGCVLPLHHFRQSFKWSGERDSNPQRIAWKATDLPLIYPRKYSLQKHTTKKLFCQVFGADNGNRTRDFWLGTKGFTPKLCPHMVIGTGIEPATTAL